MHGMAKLISERFVNLTDPRQEPGKKHPLLNLIFIALTASICGANTWADVERFAKAKRAWFDKYLDSSAGIPSHDTFGRVFARLDTAEFLTALQNWVKSFAGELRGEHVALDGKTLRGSFDRAAEQSALHLLTAYATRSRLCLQQLKVDGKSNEIPAAVELLNLMELAGAVVTLDAMHCQVETAQTIVNREADYVLTVKGNQSNLQDALYQAFTEHEEGVKPLKELRKIVTNEKSHGRKERREYLVAPVPNEEVFMRWPGIRAIGMVFREWEAGEKHGDEVTFFISSLPPNVKRLGKLLRDHWKIESNHYVLDVTFAEDASRIHKGNGPEIAGAFRRMALNILQLDTSVKDNIHGKRVRAGWDESLLDRMYAAISRL